MRNIICRFIKEIIPLYYINDDIQITDIRIKPLLIKNTGYNELELSKIEIIGGGPLLDIWHRRTVDEEFAFDIAMVKQNRNNELSTRKNLGNELKDFHVYGKDIIAVEIGKVYQVEKYFKDDVLMNPGAYTHNELKSKLDKLKKEYPDKNIYRGNSIILQHKENQFSMYCHLCYDSINLNKGVQIRKGNVIGKVGNTGYSIQPHLHFQVMNKDMVTIPVKFRDIDYEEINDSIGNNCNTLCYSNYIYIKN